MAHEYNRFGPVVETVLYGLNCPGDTCRVFDFSFLDGDVKVNAHEDALALDEVGDVVDGELLG